jgi:hypothetical protein
VKGPHQLSSVTHFDDQPKGLVPKYANIPILG